MMRRCVACVHRGLGRRAQRSSCIFSASSALVSPSRWLTRVTCVSTAMAGIPKALPSTTLAVLRPTPGSSTSSSTVRGTTPPWSSTSACPMPMSDLALALKKPVEWISVSRVEGRARAKSSAVRYRVKSVRVTALTRSSVHCADRIVAARSSRGVVKSSSIPAFGYALARRPRILTALAFFAAADSAMVGLGEGGANLPDAPRHLVFGELLRLVGKPPDGPARLGVAGQTRHEMPVDVRHLIAEELVVHLDGLVDGRQPS